MYYDVIKIKILNDYQIDIYFENGKHGVVDFRKYIEQGGLFSRLSNPEYFNKAFVDPNWAALCWPDNLDIASETIYSDATGEPLPDWTKRQKHTG